MRNLTTQPVEGQGKQLLSATANALGDPTNWSGTAAGDSGRHPRSPAMSANDYDDANGDPVNEFDLDGEATCGGKRAPTSASVAIHHRSAGSNSAVGMKRKGSVISLCLAEMVLDTLADRLRVSS